MEVYNSADVYKILNISKAKTQRFVTDKLVFPLKDSTGPGTSRVYSPRNLSEITLVSLLFDRGLTTPAIREAMDTLRLHYEELDKKEHFFLDPYRFSSKGSISYLVSTYTGEWKLFTYDHAKEISLSISSEDIGTLSLVIGLTNIAANVFMKLKDSHKKH